MSDQSLVVIPKSAVLSTHSCALADHIPHAPYGHDATLTLALALYSEQLLLSRSRWAGYLQSLPDEQNWDGIALFWDAALRGPLSSRDASDDGRRVESGDLGPDSDAVEAREWLRGTEAETHLLLRDSPRTPLLNEISGFYFSIAAPLLEHAGLSASERGFQHAYALVSSRAFMVDAYHGLAMVPIADAFNHAQENNIHLESDYDVCTSCGSLSECPHDVEAHGDVSVPAPDADAADPENTCEMVVNAPIAPGAEAFNTYGAKLTNAELLVRYGFMLDANDNDTLTWTLEEIWDAAGATLDDLRPRRWDDHAGYGACMEILRDWQYDAGWADSESVIDTEPSENRNPLYVTADGVLSHKLWLAIALATLWLQGMTVEVAQMGHLVTRIARAQFQLEQGQTESRKEGGDEDDDAYEALDRLVRTIGELCVRRLDRISRLNVRQQDDRGIGQHSATVGKYIDVSILLLPKLVVATRVRVWGKPPVVLRYERMTVSFVRYGGFLIVLILIWQDLDSAQQKTHLAVTLALGEISIVESCVGRWDELTAIAQNRQNRHY